MEAEIANLAQVNHQDDGELIGVEIVNLAQVNHREVGGKLERKVQQGVVR